MDVLEAIGARRSRRKYLPGSVPPEMVSAILEAGRNAPSGHNNQPWRFVVVSSRKTIELFSKMTKYSGVMASAPLLIAVFLDQKAVYDRTKDLQSMGACIQNMWLSAHALGLGLCWNGEILNKRGGVERMLGLPSRYELMAVLCIGFPDPAENLAPAERAPLDQLVLARIADD